MTFEEFFKKKRIDLAALLTVKPALFSEFKLHFEQMGEKSFDHTKKYWFNTTRREFPLAPEIKTEKVHIANPLAEQTITESLIETMPAPATPAPKLGFAPKFKATNMVKPGINDENKKEDATTQPKVEDIPAQKPVEEPVAKPAYQPRFKMQHIKPKPEN